MQTCQIWGDMSADRVDDQYPTVTVCDACAEAHSQGENAAILHVVGGYDEDYGEQCYFCGITRDEESEQRKGRKR
jgi:hypothetical protein